MRIDGAVVLITGASSGIGAATARAAAAAGARVALLARRRDRIGSLAATLPDALAVPCDVTDRGQVDAAVRAVLKRFGRIDVLINNAGQGLHVPVDRVDPDDFRAILELNLIAPLVLLQAVLPTMRLQGAGAVIDVSSGTTLAPIPGTAAYAASKAALNMLDDVARRELASSGITVSTVLPFATRTEFHDSLRADSPAQTAQRSGMTPQEPEEVAAVILRVIDTGAPRADLVPIALGGSYNPPHH